MQLSFDAADRLVELIQSRRGPLAADEAACALFALASAPTAIARSLLDDVVTGDSRLAWRGGDLVGLVGAGEQDVQLEDATFVVFDLETTGLRPGASRICEIGAQRVERLELGETFETLVDPGQPLPAPIAALTGIQPAALRGAPRPEHAVRQFIGFVGDAVLVAHNARFDLGFLDREVERITGRRVAAPVVDTVWLARRLLGDRIRRVGLASLAHFLGVPTTPCHRALPDARATAEVLVRLIGLAQERGARSVSDLVDLSVPRARKLQTKRHLVARAPATPGVYVFRDVHGQPLYVGRARSLRTRLRSYFAGGRQRPSVETALHAAEQIEWSVTGSELEAALVELRLLRELRPPANARDVRPDRHVYLRRDGTRWRVTHEPGGLGPLRSRRTATAAARALDGLERDDPAAALPGLRARLRRLADDLRFEDAARLRDRVAALEDVVQTLTELERARGFEACVLAPGDRPGTTRAFFVSRGRVACERVLPRGGGARVEAAAGIAEARHTEPSLAAEDADEVLVVTRLLRRPSPELCVLPFDASAIAAAVDGVPLAA